VPLQLKSLSSYGWKGTISARSDGLDLKTLVEIKFCGLNVTDGAKGASEPANVASYKRLEKDCSRLRRAYHASDDSSKSSVQLSQHTTHGFPLLETDGVTEKLHQKKASDAPSSLQYSSPDNLYRGADTPKRKRENVVHPTPYSDARKSETTMKKNIQSRLQLDAMNPQHVFGRSKQNTFLAMADSDLQTYTPLVNPFLHRNQNRRAYKDYAKKSDPPTLPDHPRHVRKHQVKSPKTFEGKFQNRGQALQDKTSADIILTQDMGEVQYIDPLGADKGYSDWVHRCVHKPTKFII
jgi:hypothetical protein